MPPAFDQLSQSLRQLPPRRLAVLAAVVVGVVVLLLAAARWASQPDYALLFGGLPSADAGQVVERLETDGVPYSLRDGGTSIYVPTDQVYSLRLRLASDGVVQDGPAGYELFDGGTLGMTDFMQRLNVKRALEGELARTIGAIRQVESARVHLVLPERSPFRDQQATPSASVVLSVRGQLAPDQVAGVTGLVAGAVEGMSPAEVTVLDQAGRMLASPQMSAGDGGLSTAQLRMRQEVEDHLAQAGQSMLDQLLGPGRAVVRVAAELDPARTQTETNSVDPESQTMISEERQEETGAGAGSSSTVRNFELTRQTIRAEQEAGRVQTLTVSVLLDEAAPPVEVGRPREEDAPTPFTDAQLGQIESLVKNAVGFSDERGDRLTVQQIRFSPAEPDDAGVMANPMEWAALGGRYLVILLALFLAYRLLRGLARTVTAPLAPPALAEQIPTEPTGAALAQTPVPAFRGDGAGVPLPALATPRTTIEAVDGDPYAARLSDEARELLADDAALLADVTAHVQNHPDAAAALVRSWLRDDAVPA